jgi:hypothetical protein
MNTRQTLLTVALAAFAGAAGAQDFDAMIRQQLQAGQALSMQMQQAEQQIVQQTMQNPDCQAKYQQHLASGGTLSYPQFAYQYAATGGFTPGGIANFRRSEQANQAAEMAKWNDLRGAQDQRAAAQGAYAESYFQGQQEQGRVMQGQSTWVDPASGQSRALSYLGGNAYVDPNTGQAFVRDERGQFYAQGPDGGWYPMTPSR